MTTEEKEILKHQVFTACSKHPDVLRPIIDAATEGVKSFADSQSDRSAKIAFAMTDVLASVKVDRFEHFSMKEILDILEPTLGGTVWMDSQRRKLKKRTESTVT